jgi:nucleoside-diphosphate-sugar epimerase
LKVLFIGGTGVISMDTVRLASAEGREVTVLNRGHSPLARFLPETVRQLVLDIYDRPKAQAALAGMHFDVIVDCISYTPEQLRYKLELFRGKYRQFVFISSTAVYKPDERPQAMISENSILGNFGWDYGRDKAACEYELLREHVLYGSGYTIIRPCETYNDLRIPGVIVAGPLKGGYTILNRMRQGKPVIVHDDGGAHCPFLHARDIAVAITGLFMQEFSFGEAYHITGEKLYSWREVTEIAATAAGVKANIVYVSSREFTLAMPMTPHGDTYGVIMCAKQYDCPGYNNTKIKNAVPRYAPGISLEEGVAASVRFYDEHPELKTIDEKLDADLDRVTALFSPGAGKSR